VFRENHENTTHAKRSLYKKSCVAFVFSCVSWLIGGWAANAAEPPRVFRWAGDPEGGAPFVESDPSHPDTLVGFDVEIATLIAQSLGRTPEFINISFYSIDQSIARGDAEIGMSGMEDTPARRATLAVTSATPTRRGSARSPTCGAERWRRWRARWRTRFSRRPSATSASTPSHTKTTCIRTAI
jgi:hypothetical protein